MIQGVYLMPRQPVPEAPKSTAEQQEFVHLTWQNLFYTFIKKFSVRSSIQLLPTRRTFQSWLVFSAPYNSHFFQHLALNTILFFVLSSAFLSNSFCNYTLCYSFFTLPSFSFISSSCYSYNLSKSQFNRLLTITTSSLHCFSLLFCLKLTSLPYKPHTPFPSLSLNISLPLPRSSLPAPSTFLSSSCLPPSSTFFSPSIFHVPLFLLSLSLFHVLLSLPLPRSFLPPVSPPLPPVF